MKITTHYDNLKVSRTASQEEIKRAYRKLCALHHPDKFPDNQKEKQKKVLQIINRSYSVLSNERLRSEHNAWIRAKEQNSFSQNNSHSNNSNHQNDQSVKQNQSTKNPNTKNQFIYIVIFIFCMSGYLFLNTRNRQQPTFDSSYYDLLKKYSDPEYSQLIIKAKEGDVQAQLKLADQHYYGEGVDYDPFLAFAYYQLAAKQGNSRAWYQLGIIYRELMTPEAEPEVQNYFKQACDLGYTKACDEYQSFNK